jgi:hypothetical protein
MTKEIAMDDAEIAALLDELEAEQSRMTATPVASKPQAKPTPVVEPEPKIEIELEPEPEPEVEFEPEPEVKPEPIKVPARKRVKAAEVESKISVTPEIAPVTVELAVKPSPELSEVIDRAERVVASIQESEIVAQPIDSSVTGDKTAKLNYYVDISRFNSDTKLTEATLDKAMMEQSGLRAFYGSQAAQAEAQHARLKIRFEVLEAKLYDEHRKVLAAGTEKVTEKMVENAVKLDPRWLKGKNAVVEADTIASVNKSLVIALADRKDMLVQLGADRREEFKGGVRIMAAQDERDTVAERAKAAFKNGRGIQ